LNIGKADEGQVSSVAKKLQQQQEGGENTTTKAPINTCCFICLSEPMVDPFALPKCGHAFCFSCLQSWQSFAHPNNPSSGGRPLMCPACREEAPDIVKSIHETALLYSARANNDDLTEDEQKHYSELALEELDKIDQGATMDPSQKIQTLYTKAEILHQLDRPAEALKAFEEAEALHEEGAKNRSEIIRLLDACDKANIEGRIEETVAIHLELEEKREAGFNVAMLGNNFFDLHLNMAECKEAMGDYKGAMEIYKFKFMAVMDAIHTDGSQHPESTPPQQRRMLMGMSKCMYHLGKYELAIELGESAIEMNRYFPQVHKYVALSQMANGDANAAMRTMGRAVCYETPWDEANRKIVQKMHEETKKKAASTEG
jgi:tetratricopeptide (TPR) repeat protein